MEQCNISAMPIIYLLLDLNAVMSPKVWCESHVSVAEPVFMYLTQGLHYEARILAKNIPIC